MPSFSSPYFLYALALAGLPVLIHFLTRPKPRVIRYPTFHLLVEAGGGKQALHRLRTFLLLAARVLAIAALVFIFADPRLEHRSGQVSGETKVKKVALLLDASMSMTGVRNGVSLFAETKARAAEILRHLDSESPVTIILIKSRPEQLLPALSRNHNALHQQLANATPTLEKGNPTAALDLASQLLDGGGKVYILSDFQRSDWSSVTFPENKNLSIILHPMVTTGINNVGIVDLKKSPVKPVVNEPVELSCTLFNATAVSRSETVHFDLPGISGSTDVKLQPFGAGTASYTVSMPEKGCTTGSIRLNPDNMEADNSHYFTICAQDAFTAQVISNNDFDDPDKNVFFLSRALAPFPDTNPGLRIINQHSEDLDRSDLEISDAFFLVPPITLTPEIRDNIIRRIIVDGATLFVVTHDFEIMNVLEQLSSSSSGVLSLPFTMTSELNFSASGLGQPISTTGLLDFFSSSGQNGLATLSLYNHFQTNDIPQREADILLRHDDGSAALSLSKAGQGHIVGINMGLTPEDGNLVSSPLFPVILQEIVTTLRNKDIGEAVHPGDAVTFSLLNHNKPDDFESLRIKGPEGETIEPEFINGPGRVQVRTPVISLPGHYRPVPQSMIPDIAVVNVDPQESDTRIIPPGELTKIAGEDPAADIKVLNEQGELYRTEEALRLWPYLIIAAALFFILEMVLSSFGLRKNNIEGRRS